MHEDLYTLTMSCFLKENCARFKLNHNVRDKLIYATVWITVTQAFMLWAMFYAIKTDENGEYTKIFPENFALFLVKIPCACALHFGLHPEMGKGLKLMNFTNNQRELFCDKGSEISFIVSCLQVLSAVIAEIINIYLLAY